jgi:hypothetical protein
MPTHSALGAKRTRRRLPNGDIRDTPKTNVGTTPRLVRVRLVGRMATVCDRIRSRIVTRHPLPSIAVVLLLNAAGSIAAYWTFDRISGF